MRLDKGKAKAPADGICTAMNGDHSACHEQWAVQLKVGCRHEHITTYWVCARHNEALMQVDAQGGWICNPCKQFVAIAYSNDDVVAMAKFLVEQKPHVCRCKVIVAPDLLTSSNPASQS